MKKLIWILVIVLAISMLLPTLAACTPEEEIPSKKAIVWVTALLAGGLVDSQDGSAAWDPINSENLSMANFMGKEIEDLIPELLGGDLLAELDISALLGPVLDGVEDDSNFLWRLTLDENRVANDPDVVVATDPSIGLYYGVLRAYESQIKGLQAVYGDEYEVKVYAYDWRYDNHLAAEGLEKFMQENNYRDSVILAHSMGGAVVAEYLARSQDNRDRVAAYVSMGGTLAGSFDTWHMMENPATYVTDLLENNGMSSVLGLLDLLNLRDKVQGVLRQVQDFVVSTDTFIQLLPTWELLQSAHYSADNPAVTVDGVAITSEEQLLALYASRPWAWQKDADGNYVYNEDGSHKLRYAMEGLREYQDSLYVTLPSGERVISTSLVNTYYVTGAEVATHCGVDITHDEEGNESVTFRYSYEGDMQVLLHSLIENQDPDALLENGHLVVMHGANHYSVGCDWNLIKEELIRLIDTVAETDGAARAAELEAEQQVPGEEEPIE